MKQVLRNQNDADISTMTASHKHVTHLLRIDVVQQIVYVHKARFATTTTTEILRYTLVICRV